MMAFTGDGQADEALLAERDAEYGASTAQKREERLGLEYPQASHCFFSGALSSVKNCGAGPAAACRTAAGGSGCAAAPGLLDASESAGGGGRMASVLAPVGLCRVRSSIAT